MLALPGTLESSTRGNAGGMVALVMQTKPPREHGFWVMLVLALAVGIGAVPGATTVLCAVSLGAISIGVAIGVGRRIRRSALLQVLSGPLLAALAVPVGMVGGAPFVSMLSRYVPLALVFLATTLVVQETLYRAQKKVRAAARARWGALGVSFFAVGLSYVHHSTRVMVGLVFSAAFVLAILVAKPSTRRMKRIGLSVAVVQLVVASLLSF
jgi:putative Mn2+ efflux pump MntP